MHTVYKAFIMQYTQRFANGGRKIRRQYGNILLQSLKRSQNAVCHLAGRCTVTARNGHEDCRLYFQCLIQDPDQHLQALSLTDLLSVEDCGLAFTCPEQRKD